MNVSLYSNLLKQVVCHPHYMRSLIAKKARLLKRFYWIERHGDEGRSPLPLVYKLVLTHACNLRCRMCFQWGSTGWCTRGAKACGTEELDWEVVLRLFHQVGKYHPEFNLIGGEPLLYPHFRELADLIHKNRCNTIICTNGTALESFLDIFADNRYISLLISLDGLEATNDSIRGRGVYAKVVQHIQALRKLKRPPYVGIQFTIRPENVSEMFSFCKEMGRIGVDWVLLNLFWFITDSQAREYESFIRQHYGYDPSKHRGFLMPYAIDREVFISQHRRIRSAHFPMQVSCYLERPEEMHAYLDDPYGLVSRRRCYKQWVRVDVAPSGEVSPCIQFPDLVFGNLHDHDIIDIWNNDLFRNFRKSVLQENTPLCSKCPCIYLYNPQRKCL